MNSRISIVNNIEINSIAFGSPFIIGDTNTLTPTVKVFALQRELPIFWSYEGNFNYYNLFFRVIPKPIITEKVKFKKIDIIPTIKVNNLNIIGISSSAIVQIGSNKFVDAESRIKHVRHLLEGKSPI